MENLIVYFNELSLYPGGDGSNDELLWNKSVRKISKVIDDAISVRKDCRVALPAGVWNHDCGGQPLSIRLRDQLPRDSYRRLLSRVVQLSALDTLLEREVHFSKRVSIGLTLADLAASEWSYGWAVSLGFPDSPWLLETVTGSRFVLNKSGELEGPTDCIVCHLSEPAHVKRWEGEIRDWGAIVAASSELDVVDGHPIVMYSAPLEHGPPHVHLLESRTTRRTLAKYRIDVFERPKGPRDWDSVMRVWVEKYRDQLMRSWDRCQRGGHPYSLE